MTAQHIEKAFEDAIEAHLLAHGWLKGDPAHFNRDLALDPTQASSPSSQETQPELWAELRKQHGSGLEPDCLDALAKALETRGTLDVLRARLQVLRARRSCGSRTSGPPTA